MTTLVYATPSVCAFGGKKVGHAPEVPKDAGRGTGVGKKRVRVKEKRRCGEMGCPLHARTMVPPTLSLLPRPILRSTRGKTYTLRPRRAAEECCALHTARRRRQLRSFVFFIIGRLS